MHIFRDWLIAVNKLKFKEGKTEESRLLEIPKLPMHNHGLLYLKLYKNAISTSAFLAHLLFHLYWHGVLLELIPYLHILYHWPSVTNLVPGITSTYKQI